mmetsp:Transcript_39545/g.86305  ORF Transcript_39545/g.86305 Transcript_39545/m.86305 type:complete len:371 (-) Transcript_39545:112-1224(-)|eukprot:CAMPEP_0204391930 /NCGR_PEP_ID=MMETSP0469-20131031/61496_1 /ASSEMBLY_ACC=CAM_ASM_000384 /TAXON_ID=2969 /ORGANISM="Oxyrrhis marina" /LENGTH=370 /DNA_ID=CAMNT_0051385893 /DNA_START=42 /DNA_END=1154 /DNA_ORIENTATION=+
MAIRRAKSTANRATPYGQAVRPGVISAPAGVPSNKGLKPAKGSGKGGGPATAVPRQSGTPFPMERKYGQNLLKNPGILDKIVDAADLRSADVVLEIGPGTGNLTLKCLAQCRRVEAIEVDPRMAAEVKKRVVENGRTNLNVIIGDALRTNFPVFDVCVANLPYQISSPFVFKLLAHRPWFRTAVIMFQQEFAERLVADVNTDKYGRLAVNCQLFAKITRVCKVGRANFNPPPKVDSMVVKIVPRVPPIEVNFREWDGLMRICFNRKRKTLSAGFKVTTVIKTLEDNYKTFCSLKNVAPSATPFKELLLEPLAELNLATKRAVQLDLDQFFALLLAFNKRGIHFTNVADRNTSTAEIDPSLFVEQPDAEME